MSSFYITLPSNTGIDTSQLSTSNYTVRLPTTPDLSEGEWTVALSSIIYPVTFHSEEDKMLIILNYIDGKRKIFEIPGKAFDSVLEMESIINEIIFGDKIERTPEELLREKRKKRSVPTEYPKEPTDKGVESVPKDGSTQEEETIPLIEKEKAQEETEAQKEKRQATTRTAEQMLSAAVNEIKKSSNDKKRMYLNEIKKKLVDLIRKFTTAWNCVLN